MNTNRIQVPCGSADDIRPFAGAGKLPSEAFRSAAFLRRLFKHTRAWRSRAAAVGGTFSHPQAWVWSRKHYPLAAKLDFCFIASVAIPGCSEKQSWCLEFGLCLFSLTVVLINIFLWSPQTAQGCSWKAKTNSRSGFLLFAIIICEKWNHSSLCSDFYMNTLTNFQ